MCPKEHESSLEDISEQELSYFEIQAYLGTTKHVTFRNPNMELIDATKLRFKEKVKKLPIRDGNRLAGLVTLTDIARVTSVDEETMKLIEKLSNMHLIN
jgi:CBS domain-containing protein